jgi:hypothetical protein
MAEYYPDGATVYYRMEAERFWSNKMNQLL